MNKGRFRTGQGFIILALSIGLVLLSFVLFRAAFSQKYLQIDRLAAAIIFSLFFLFILIKGFTEYKSVTIYDDHIKVRWVFGLIWARLTPAQLKQFGKTTKYIYINSNKFDLLLNESLIENQLILIDQLKSWGIKRKDNILVNEVSPIEKRIGGLALMLFSILIFTIMLVNYFKPDQPINSLTSISGHLSRDPDITRGKSSKNITFYLQEYPGVQFETGNTGYYLINRDSLSLYGPGNTITVSIRKNDFEKKLALSAEPTFNEKHFSWSQISVYSVELENNTLFSFQAYQKRVEKLSENNFIATIFTIGLFIFMFVVGLRRFRGH